ncbi:5-formyltetrahydrofolate cyclo-ligase [Aurantivibrio plasticivorans]
MTNLPSTLSIQRKNLRQKLRMQRRTLTTHQQLQAAIELDRLVSRQPVFLHARRIALYLANDGEIDPSLLWKRALGMDKQCFLPVLDPHHAGTLKFAPYDAESSLDNNRFGIPEPTTEPIATETLDIVFMPLVGFDHWGQRLGMGGGFYDRTFAFKADQAEGEKPLLIGLAHQCQEVDRLPVESWDIPLDGIISDGRIIAPGSLASDNFLAGDLRRKP